MKGWYGNKMGHSLASRGIKSGSMRACGENVEGISLKQKEINKSMADEILEFLRAKHLGGDLRIYFNDIAYSVDYGGVVNVNHGIKGSEYSEFANDETITMTFEGDFYTVMNGYTKENFETQEEFSNILDKYGYYYELGNAWNLALYEG